MLEYIKRHAAARDEQRDMLDLAKGARALWLFYMRQPQTLETRKRARAAKEDMRVFLVLALDCRQSKALAWRAICNAAAPTRYSEALSLGMAAHV